MTADLKEEKDRLRRIRHSKVEKRRRQNISKCLERLVQLVPKSRDTPNNYLLGTIQILTNAIEYIQEMKNNSADSSKPNCTYPVSLPSFAPPNDILPNLSASPPMAKKSHVNRCLTPNLLFKPVVFPSQNHCKSGSNSNVKSSVCPTVLSLKRSSQDPNYPMRLSNLIS
ncbi:hypothetical protein BC833DRAFT_563537 [Globomyces pollinis-pini]|nr:hypothetical protein BC833DRAFT_563537 [Globomyces pollinis-pini]